MNLARNIRNLNGKRAVELRRRPFSASFGPFSRSLETPLPWQQPASEHVQVRQRKRRVEPSRVLRQAAITDLAEAPQPFDDMERVLASGSRLRTASVDVALVFGQRSLLGAATVDPVADTALKGRLPVRLLPVGLIAVARRSG